MQKCKKITPPVVGLEGRVEQSIGHGMIYKDSISYLLTFGKEVFMKRLHGAFISARYSTDNQNPDSIEVQVAKCTEWCNKNNMAILGVFADEAVSGMKDTRPQYAAMMDQLRMGLADTVVIYDQSRMFRKWRLGSRSAPNCQPWVLL